MIKPIPYVVGVYLPEDKDTVRRLLKHQGIECVDYREHQPTRAEYLMTPQEKNRFDILFAMFESEGWKQFMAELQESAIQINQLNAASDEKDFREKKGMVTVLANILGFENAQRELYNQMDEEDQAA